MNRLDDLLWLLCSPFNKKWQAYQKECRELDKELTKFWQKQKQRIKTPGQS